MHTEAFEWCKMWGSDQRGNALDVGGRNVNGTARECWPNMTWTVLDINGDPDNYLDAVITADARRWRPDRKYDLVLSTEMLEHVKGWILCVEMMVEALDDDGLLVITCAGPGRPPHNMHDGTELPPDQYYQNISPVTLHQILSENGLIGIDINVKGSDVRAIASKQMIL